VKLVSECLREKQSLPAVNVKRVYRVMRDHNLLLERRVN
jgi:putative transposase